MTKQSFGAVIVLTAFVVIPATAQPPVESKFVTQQYAAAIVFEPARLEKSAQAAGLSVAGLWKTIEEMGGPDVKQFERITCLIDLLPNGDLAFMPAFVLRYPPGTDARRQITPLLGGEVKEFKVGNVDYVRSTKIKLAQVEMSGHIIDDSTLLIAVWPILEPMLKPGGENDKGLTLAAELAKADFDHDVTFIVSMPPTLRRFVKHEKKVGPEDLSAAYKSAKLIMEQTEAMTLTLDLGKETVVRAEFRCGNAWGAGVFQDTLKSVLSKLKDAYPVSRKDLGLLMPTAIGHPVMALLDEGVRNHKLTKNDNKVVLTVARPRVWNPKK
jgi:hypothetical protein